MANNKVRTHAVFSLRTQLAVGSVVLLALTLGPLSYSLLQHEKHILEEEVKKTIVLQGRNIALSSERSLLRSDPEFELFPLVKRILSENTNITSVVVTDADGLIQGDAEIQNLAQPYHWDLSGHTVTTSAGIADDEALYESHDLYRFKTPVKSRNNNIGYVYIEYSRAEFHESFARAVNITIIIGSIAFALGILLSAFVFKRISNPMRDLMRGVERIGEGHLDTNIQLNVKNEFSVLADSFNTMAGKIARAQEDLVAKQRMERELEIAREIQATLIPEKMFDPPGLEVGTYYNSAEQVGGDYLDVIPIDPRNIAFVMADVSGKGVPGLVVMAMLKIMVRTLVGKNVSPREVIRRLNTSVADHIREKMFVTFFIAYFNLDTGEVVYSNAGHNPLLFYRAASRACELQRMKGPLLGVFRDADYAGSLEEYRTILAPGDILMQYTDGLSESANTGGELFNFERIIALANEHAPMGARALVQAMTGAERDFRGSAAQADDIALLAVGVKETTRMGQVTEPSGKAGV